MQSASSNFTQEASGGNVVWAKPRVFADWDRTGYGAAGSIDDLSNQVGDNFTITHALDDGLPDDVSLSTSQDAVSLVAPLAYGRTPGQGVAEGNRRASQYFSPYNGSSPVSAFDRDVAPVTLDWGLVHAGGQEYIRIFTGQMTNLRTRGQVAEMGATSATRLKLAKLIQPPAVDALSNGTTAVLGSGGPGMNGTWPVSWALAQCGVYASPPPRTGCRLWMPMHGSLTTFIPRDNHAENNVISPGPTSIKLTAAGVSTTGTPNWRSGPFLVATDDYVTATESKRTLIYNVRLDSGADILSQAGNAGRVEFWIKGDPAEVVNPPGGAGNVPWLAGFDFKSTTAVDAQAGVGTDRKVYVTVNDGAGHTVTLKSPTTLATDGAWYFVGMAWDIANKKLWVNHNGTVTTTAAPTLVTTSLPLHDDFDMFNFQPSWSAHLPVAEVQVTADAQANPDTTIWINDPAYWSGSQVVMRPSILNLRVLTEPVPREAWEFIGSFAQAELAQTRTDELDRFCYLPLSYWAEDAQQTVVDTISSSRNAQDIDVELDPTKIRNSVRITYSSIHVDSVYVENALYDAQSGPPLPPGETIVTFSFQDPAVDVFRLGLETAFNDDSILSQHLPQTGTYFSISPVANGGTPYATQNEIDISLVSWDAGQATFRFYNKTPTTYYFANTSNEPSIHISGHKVQAAEAAVVGQDASSIAQRGERALALDLPIISDQGNAQAIANELAARLSRPVALISDVQLFADPRRQPGDLIQLDDSINTFASGLWRLQSITHDRSGADYTQQALVNEALPVGHWDVDGWDNFVWGP
jgi:hypothetical protein